MMTSVNIKPYISVIVPAHNEEKYIHKTLSSVIKQDYGSQNYEIIVVDNNSTDRTKEIVKEFQSVSYYFKKDGPVGAVRNYGVNFSKGEVIAFIDGDCIADKSWLSTGVNLLYSMDEIGAVGGKYSLDKSATWIERYWLLGVNDEAISKLDLLGGDTITKREVFYKVGMFDENITSGEDTKLTYKIRSHGYLVKIDKSLNVIHLGNAKNVKEFIYRQIWHSENYILNLRESLQDITFYMVVSFLLFACTAMASIPFSFPTTTATVTGTCLIASTFSVKRVLRSNRKTYRLDELSLIFFIDYLYLIGRSLGFLKGILASYRRK